MNNLENRAIEIIKDFCFYFYKKRDTERALKNFSEDVFWMGPTINSQITNLEELKTILLLETSIISSSYNIISLYEKAVQITKDIYNVQYNFKIINKKLNLDFTISMLSTIDFDKEKVVSIKFDYVFTAEGCFNNNINGGILLTQFETRNYVSIKSINFHFKQLFSLSDKEANEIINTNIFDYIHGADVTLFKHQFFSNKTLNTPHGYKCRIKLKDSYKSIILTSVSKINENKKIYYMVIQTTDEENETEEYQNTLSPKKLIDLGYIYHENYFDDNFQLIKANEKFSNLLGYTPKELIKKTKKNYFDLIFKEDQEYVKKAYSKLNNTRAKNYIAFRLLTKDNKVIWVKETLTLLNKKTRGLVIKAIIEELNYLNNKQGYTTNDLITQKKFDSIFLVVDLVNRKFETEVFENSRIKFTTKYVSNIPNSLIEKNIIYKDDIKSFIDFFNKALKKQKNNWIGRIILKSNKIGWYQISSYTLFNNNKPIKALCLITNIHKIKNILESFNKHQELINIIISDYDFIGEYDSFSNRPLFMYSPKNIKDFIEHKKENNFDFLIYNVIHRNYMHLLIEERNKTLNHTFNGIIPENNEFEIQYKSLSNRFSGYQWGKIKYVYNLDTTTKHLNTIIFIKNINSEKTKKNY